MNKNPGLCEGVLELVHSHFVDLLGSDGDNAEIDLNKLIAEVVSHVTNHPFVESVFFRHKNSARLTELEPSYKIN